MENLRQRPPFLALQNIMVCNEKSLDVASKTTTIIYPL